MRSLNACEYAALNTMFKELLCSIFYNLEETPTEDQREINIQD